MSAMQLITSIQPAVADVSQTFRDIKLNACHLGLNAQQPERTACHPPFCLTDARTGQPSWVGIVRRAAAPAELMEVLAGLLEQPVLTPNQLLIEQRLGRARTPPPSSCRALVAVSSPSCSLSMGPTPSRSLDGPYSLVPCAPPLYSEVECA